VGSNSSPTFADIDGDGDKDVLLGASNGTVFFRNTETNTSPVFVKETLIKLFIPVLSTKPSAK